MAIDYANNLHLSIGGRILWRMSMSPKWIGRRLAFWLATAAVGGVAMAYQQMPRTTEAATSLDTVSSVSKVSPHLDTAADCGTGQNMPRAKANELARAWISRVLDVHPNPFQHVTESQLNLHVESLKFPAQVSEVEVHRELARLAAFFRDSHTGVRSNRSVGGWPRMPLQMSNGALCLTEDWATLPVHSCLLEVSGVASDTLVDWALELANAETLEGRRSLVPRFLPLALSGHGLTLPLRATFVEPRGRRRVQTLTEQSLDDVSLVSPLELAWPAKDIALLTVRSFAGDLAEYFAEALPKVFQAIEQQRTSGLILDLRDNVGGDTTVVEHFMSYVTASPFRLFSRKHWRVSGAMKEQLFASGKACDYNLLPIDSFVDTDVDERVEPRPDQGYSGAVVVLVGPRTQSAALMLAEAVREYDLGVLVGAPLRGSGGFNAEVHRFPLGCTSLEGYVSTAEFTRASGNPYDQRALVPHLTIHDDLASGQPHRSVSAAVALLESWRSRQSSRVARSRAPAVDLALDSRPSSGSVEHAMKRRSIPESTWTRTNW